MTPTVTKPKPLTTARLHAEVAKQTLWAIVNRYNGKVWSAHPSRDEARIARGAKAAVSYSIVRVDLRVKGQRP